jgi:hypothetical protein
MFAFLCVAFQARTLIGEDGLTPALCNADDCPLAFLLGLDRSLEVRSLLGGVLKKTCITALYFPDGHSIVATSFSGGQARSWAAYRCSGWTPSLCHWAYIFRTLPSTEWLVSRPVFFTTAGAYLCRCFCTG